MRWTPTRLIIAGLFFIFLLWFFLFGFWLSGMLPISFKPLPDLANLPIYPGAERLTVSNDTGTLGKPWRTISYYTDAEPETVLAFYKTRLLEDHWELSQTPRPPDYLSVLWTDGPGMPAHSLYVTARRADLRETYVQMNQRSSGPR
jgi:hypothetical protein